MKKYASYIVATAFALSVLTPFGFALATIYSAGSLLQIGDVQSKHILDGTILNADINGTAKISALKIAPGGVGGEILLAGGDRIASTTGFLYATSTGLLTVPGGVLSQASSTVVGDHTTTGNETIGGNATVSGNLTISGTCTGCGGSAIQATFTAGAPIAAGDAVVVADGVFRQTDIIRPVVQNTTTSWGHVSAQTKKAFSFYPHGVASSTNQFVILLSKTGSPVDNATCEIDADSAGTPSGTALGSASVSGASLTGSLASTTFSYTGFAMTPNVRYWIVCSRSGALDAANYYTAGADSSASSTASLVYNGTSWSDNADTGAVAEVLNIPAAGTAFEASASVASTTNPFIGFAPSAITISSTGTLNVGGITTGLSSLTTGMQYYLANKAGAVSTAAGTISRKACIALSSTTCLITNIW